MQNTRRSASYSEKGPIKCRRNPFDLLFVLIMINIIHPKRRAGAFYSFFWKCKIFRSGKDCWLSVHCLCFNCSSATFLWPKVFGGRGRLFAPIESSSGIVRRIENLTKLLKIPHSQKARGLSRAGMILMVGIGQYWLIYIETKFSEWLLVWQWQWWMNGASNLPASRSLLSLVAVSSDLISRSDHHGRNERTPPSSFSTSSQGRLTSLSKFAGFVCRSWFGKQGRVFLEILFLPLWNLASFNFSISSLLSKGSLN